MLISHLLHLSEVEKFGNIVGQTAALLELVDELDGYYRGVNIKAVFSVLLKPLGVN